MEKTIKKTNEKPKVKDDECVEDIIRVLWTKWVVGRMRRMHGANCRLTDIQLREQGKILTSRMDANWQRMVTSPRNRDRLGFFCMRNAQHGIFADLNAKQLDKMISHMETFEFQLREQKIALRNVRTKTATKNVPDPAPKIPGKPKVENETCVENNVVALWNKWALGRMRRMHGGNCKLTDEQLFEQKRVLTTRMDSNWQKMSTDTRNRDERGLFCMRRAKDHMLADLSEMQLDKMVRHTELFETQLRDQKNALRLSHQTIKR